MVQFISVIAIVILTVIDQIIKFFVVTYLKPIGSKMLIPGFLRLSYVENNGAMMGLLGDKVSVMTVATIAVLTVLLILLLTKKIKFGFVYCTLVAIAAGGFGNLIDRIFRGFVVDYIEVLFVDFYVFNFADCLVTVGAFLIVFYEIYEIIRDSKKEKEVKNV